MMNGIPPRSDSGINKPGGKNRNKKTAETAADIKPAIRHHGGKRKSSHRIKQLMDTLFDELGVEVTLPNGAVVRGLFQARDKTYELSHSELTATIGTIELPSSVFDHAGITVTNGLTLVIEGDLFRVIQSPQLDRITQCWQLTVMLVSEAMNAEAI